MRALRNVPLPFAKNDAQRTNFGIISLLLITGYFLLAWYLVGRDPKKGVIIPRYDPPVGYSPAAVRYLYKLGYDHKAFAAALISAAVKGHLTITETPGTLGLGRKYRITRMQGGTSPLTRDEQDLVDRLFDGIGETISLDHDFAMVIHDAMQLFSSVLKAKAHGPIEQTNGYAFWPGMVITLLLFLGMLLGPLREGRLFITGGSLLGMLISFILVFVLLGGVAPRWVKIFLGERTRFLRLIRLVVVTVVLLACTVFAFSFAGDTAQLLVFGSLFFGLNVLFFHLIKTTTKEWRELMDEIEGFRLYLNVAEREELRLAGAPQKTPQLYEAYLPYALALDVEQHWSERFASVLATAGEAGERYSPDWYEGTAWSSFGAGGFATSLGQTMSHAIGSSSTPPAPPSSGIGGGGWSSGLGGGGFSGGGGGGGGGGGW